MSRWIEIDPDNLPGPEQGPFLCTNNLAARNAHGRMSHVFLTNMFHKQDGPQGPVSAFAEPSGMRIWSVTHYQTVEPDE